MFLLLDAWRFFFIKHFFVLNVFLVVNIKLSSGASIEEEESGLSPIQTRSLPQPDSQTHHHQQHYYSGFNFSVPNESDFFEKIYNRKSSNPKRKEQLEQMSSWLSKDDATIGQEETTNTDINSNKERIAQTQASNEQQNQDSGSGYFAKAEALKGDLQKTNQQLHHHQPVQPSLGKVGQTSGVNAQINLDENGDDIANAGSHNSETYDETEASPSGTVKTPPCAQYGRYYCNYKEDYPIKVVTEVIKYYKWPMEKLFRDLRNQVMPSLANDNHGGLVCDSITRIIRPGWTKNTNGRWLVVINTENYQQYITEVICRHGTGSYCNFIPPCYHASCKQRYNTQKLLVVDPWNPYKGPFLSEFLFPSCCICFVPSGNQDTHSSQSTLKEKFISTAPSQSTSAPSL